MYVWARDTQARMTGLGSGGTSCLAQSNYKIIEEHSIVLCVRQKIYALFVGTQSKGGSFSFNIFISQAFKLMILWQMHKYLLRPLRLTILQQCIYIYRGLEINDFTAMHIYLQVLKINDFTAMHIYIYIYRDLEIDDFTAMHIYLQRS